MTKIEIYGREYELFRNLDADEYTRIDSKLGLYKKTMLTLTNKVQLKNLKPKGWSGPIDIWIIKRGNDAQLIYPQGYSKSLIWGDEK